MIRCLIAIALTLTPAVAVARDKPGSIAARMQRVEDELAINGVIVSYAATLDTRDYTSYAALFAPDGVWSNSGGSYKGREQIRAFLEKIMGPAGAPNNANYHLVSNPRVELLGDRARATSRFLFVTRGPEGQPTPTLAGIYTDELARIGGKWLIMHRHADNVMPTSEEYRKIMEARRAGK